ncbi:helix-turn-helix domain-containing protein [Actinomadura scrupuli]|uniref:helix-turn-helix domain-containing protein n=1 Tax=Actinomadura scrupuli TaxID=559629 RepID=UPI003D964A09
MGIGETLAAARRAAGLTVTDISAKTKIREPIIEAMEQDDYALCGGDFYVRAQLRAIARAIGIDPAPLVASFDQAHGWSTGGLPAQSPSPSSRLRERLTALAGRYRPSWAVAAAIPLVAIIGYAIFALISGSHGRPHPATTVKSTPHRTPAAPVHRAAAPLRNVEVRLYAKRTSQVIVHDATGKLLFDGKVQARSHQAWTGPQRLTVTLHDAGATQLTVNGKNLGRPGRSGQVLRLSFGPGDPKRAKPADAPAPATH